MSQPTPKSPPRRSRHRQPQATKRVRRDSDAPNDGGGAQFRVPDLLKATLTGSFKNAELMPESEDLEL